LAHISELSWVKRIKHPKELLKVGDEVEVKILGYNLDSERISLGLKQTLPNPWDEIGDKYPSGLRLTRKVKAVTGSGAYIELEDGIDGFLHSENLSWTKKIKNPGSVLKEGDEIEVIVLDSNPEERKIRLGVKQLSEDPWQAFQHSYHQGSVVEGEISSIKDFGIFIKVPGEIEGLVRKSDLIDSKEGDPEEELKKYKVGDKVKAIVIDLEGDKQKAAFSIRDYKKKLENAEISHYVAGSGDSGDESFTLGDFLKSKKAEEDAATGAGTEADSKHAPS
jgi:small subunit ribosomal protein S1